jgi:hypothetical protein
MQIEILIEMAENNEIAAAEPKFELANQEEVKDKIDNLNLGEPKI